MRAERETYSAMSLSFPDEFRWGVSTAAYQIEGAAQADGRGESIWDRFSHTPGKTLNGDTGDIACDHYQRWPNDIRIMQELGVNAYRFSIAWPRILPNGRGEVNEAGLAFYDRLVNGLQDAGIEPWITLYHWDLPQALEDEGGWANRDTVDAFAEYTDIVTRRLGDRVKHWITINEPWVVATMGYHWGVMAPGRQDLKESLAVAHSLLLAHGDAVEVVRRNVPDAQVGITLNLASIYPDTESDADHAAAKRVDGSTNRWFLDPVYRGSYPNDMLTTYGDALPEIRDGDFARIARPTDFLGINNYSPFYVKHDPDGLGGIGMVEREGERTAVDWLVEPKAFEELLVRVHDDYRPMAIYVTENGAAFEDERPIDGRVRDPRRKAYIHDHILAARRAMDEDVPLAGYFVWSLLDNFEWAHGYSVRFGITYVDYASQERTIKESGRWYATVTRANALLPIDDSADETIDI
ncbi:MAG: GH1 family beta-glucosidase [Chloroflexota bacterium]|nr:GH1 family beta-glucosidase [Chloroflexota bacterium]